MRGFASSGNSNRVLHLYATFKCNIYADYAVADWDRFVTLFGTVLLPAKCLLYKG